MKTLVQTNRVHLFILAVALFAPSSSESAQTAGRPVIMPSLVNLGLRGSRQFRIEVEGRPATVASWMVNDVAGGDSTFGTITSAGLYTAPAATPKSREVHLHAILSSPLTFHVRATVILGSGAPAYRLVSRWGERGSGAGKFTDPHSLCFDRDHNLIITDAFAGHVYRYTGNGHLLGEIGSDPGSGRAQFKGPRDTKLDGAGNIVVADGDRREAGIEIHAQAWPDEPAETWEHLRTALDESFRSIDQRLQEYGPLQPDRFDLKETNGRLSELQTCARYQL